MHKRFNIVPLRFNIRKCKKRVKVQKSGSECYNECYKNRYFLLSECYNDAKIKKNEFSPFWGSFHDSEGNISIYEFYFMLFEYFFRDFNIKNMNFRCDNTGFSCTKNRNDMACSESHRNTRKKFRNSGTN